MLPHIEQKYNIKYLFLQHIGNLAYHQGKSTTSYDIVNSLTTPNNHFTLLYPDLVQELFDLSLHKSNIHTNISHSLGGLACGIGKSSSLNISLRPQEILFFLQIVSLYQFELSKGNSAIVYSSLKLAKLLGFDSSNDENISSLKASNMRATILKMTAKLESLGLLKVFRSKRRNGMDKANKLIPILPDKLYENVKDLPANLKVSDSSKLDHESNLEYILRTKLFVPIELEFMKSLFKNDLPSKYKLFFLNCMMSAYRSFKKNSGSNMLSFSSTSSELVKKNNISRSTLDRIFRYVKQQGDSFFLKVEHKYTRSDDIDCNRYDKSIFVISINPLVFPISQIRKSQTEEITEFNHDAFHNTNSPLFPDTYEGLKAAWSKKQPSIVKKTAHNNKNIIIKESNKDIDANIDNNLDEKNEELDKIAKNNQIKPQTFLKTSNSQHLESELCSLSSKSLKNSVKAFIDALPSPSNINAENASSIIQDISDRKNKINIINNCNTVIPKQTASYSTNVVIHKKKVSQAKAINDRKQKDFRYFYPLSERDIRLLNSRANREFSNNFVNQLLLKLYIKYPEKRFKNRFIFLSYMVQILANEKHQGPLVNHTSFRFSCNIGTEKKNLLEYERYLNQIEDSLDTSKEMCVKKKIAGIFSSEVAYKILTKVQFKTNHDNSFITVLIPSHIDLSERQIATLSQQLEAVYGMNGYYVQELEKEVIQPPKYRTSDIEFNDKSIGILESSKSSEAITEEILENTVWHQIRKSLREELGEARDAAWFSKAVATECEDTKTLTITMPTRFMADWVRNNYSHVIKRFTSRTAIKMVEYWYE